MSRRTVRYPALSTAAGVVEKRPNPRSGGGIGRQTALADGASVPFCSSSQAEENTRDAREKRPSRPSTQCYQDAKLRTPKARGDSSAVPVLYVVDEQSSHRDSTARLPNSSLEQVTLGRESRPRDHLLRCPRQKVVARTVTTVYYKKHGEFSQNFLRSIPQRTRPGSYGGGPVGKKLGSGDTSPFGSETVGYTALGSPKHADGYQSSASSTCERRLS